jgi:hypothetical protein
MSPDFHRAVAGHIAFIRKTHEREMRKLLQTVERELVCPHCGKRAVPELPKDASTERGIRLVHSSD